MIDPENWEKWKDLELYVQAFLEAATEAFTEQERKEVEEMEIRNLEHRRFCLESEFSPISMMVSEGISFLVLLKSFRKIWGKNETSKS